jgi:hypothetical protein
MRQHRDLKGWRILRKIQASPSDTIALVNVIQVLILNG